MDSESVLDEVLDKCAEYGLQRIGSRCYIVRMNHRTLLSISSLIRDGIAGYGPLKDLRGVVSLYESEIIRRLKTVRDDRFPQLIPKEYIRYELDRMFFQPYGDLSIPPFKLEQMQSNETICIYGRRTRGSRLCSYCGVIGADVHAFEIDQVIHRDVLWSTMEQGLLQTRDMHWQMTGYGVNSRYLQPAERFVSVCEPCRVIFHYGIHCFTKLVFQYNTHVKLLCPCGKCDDKICPNCNPVPAHPEEYALKIYQILPHFPIELVVLTATFLPLLEKPFLTKQEDNSISFQLPQYDVD
jgi:hypothetical protein